jgi:multicomponent Na+:H+ antiporter subunit C
VTTASLYALSGIALFGFGFYAVAVLTHRMRKILAVNIMCSGVFLVFVALAYRAPGGRPDPIPHAMVLTGVVVTVCFTAVALSLVRQISCGGSDAATRVDPKRPLH